MSKELELLLKWKNRLMAMACLERPHDNQTRENDGRYFELEICIWELSNLLNPIHFTTDEIKNKNDPLMRDYGQPNPGIMPSDFKVGKYYKKESDDESIYVQKIEDLDIGVKMYFKQSGKTYSVTNFVNSMDHDCIELKQVWQEISKEEHYSWKEEEIDNEQRT